MSDRTYWMMAPLRGRFSFVQILLLVFGLLSLGIAGLYCTEFFLRSVVGLDVYDLGRQEQAWLVESLFWMATAMLPVSLACYIASAFWMVRAMSNLHRATPPAADMEPFWAVAWYFVPIANLFKPYEAMSQIWEGSYRINKQIGPDQSPLPLWWALWLLVAIASRLLSRTLDAETGFFPTAELSLGYGIVMAAQVLLTYVYWRILRRVTDLQSAAMEAAEKSEEPSTSLVGDGPVSDHLSVATDFGLQPTYKYGPPMAKRER